MVQTAHIIKSIDHITEELADIKKVLLAMEIGSIEKSKKAWERIIQASSKVKWDDVSAVDEIRAQREK
jgi:hypothetical protein